MLDTESVRDKLISTVLFSAFIGQAAFASSDVFIVDSLQGCVASTIMYCAAVARESDEGAE